MNAQILVKDLYDCSMPGNPESLTCNDMIGEGSIKAIANCHISDYRLYAIVRQ